MKELALNILNIAGEATLLIVHAGIALLVSEGLICQAKNQNKTKCTLHLDDSQNPWIGCTNHELRVGDRISFR